MTGAGKDCDAAAIIAALFPEVKHVRIYLARKIAITDQPDIFGLAETVLTITPDMPLRLVAPCCRRVRFPDLLVHLVTH